MMPQHIVEECTHNDHLSPIISDGFYILHTPNKTVSTYCDMTRNGGGWTLLLTSASRQEWNASNVLDRNGSNPSLTEDFSILGEADNILGKEKFQVTISFKQYSKRVLKSNLNSFKLSKPQTD